MSAPLTRLRDRRPVRWNTLLGLVLVPLTVAGVLLWGLWNPTERLDTITAAVVNDDEPVELDGQLVPLGRVLAGELIGSASDASGSSGASNDETNFTWVLTNAEDAAEGLDDGRYATVVTIPENFSAAATSLSDGPDEARQAHIDVAESDRARLLDTALSGIVTQTATRVLNEQLGEQFVGTVFVGMNELHSGLGDAADGASALASGGRQLAGGASQLADGTSQLADGTGELASGASALSGGVSQLAGGASSLAAGASELSDGASQLSDGIGELSGGANELRKGSKQLSSGASDLAGGVSDYVDGAKTLSDAYAPLGAGAKAATTQLKTLIGALGQLAADSAEPGESLEGGLTAAGTGLGDLLDDLPTLYTDCLAAAEEPIDPADPGAGTQIPASLQQFCDGMLGTLQGRAGEIGGGLATAGDGAAGMASAMATLLETATGGSGAGGSGEDPIEQLDALEAGLDEFGSGLAKYAKTGKQVSKGASQLADGASELSGGASALAKGGKALAGGAPGLADGASQLATGAGELSTGTGELSVGASQLAAGTGELAAQTPELAKGASQLADGTKQSAAGARELSKGLGEAVTGIPNYTESQRDTMAKTAIAPVEARGASGELFTSSGVSLFAGIALWAGALALFLVLAPLWSRTRDAARGIGWIALRSAVPAVVLGAVQGVIAGIVLPIALGYDFARGASFFALALLAGVAFALVVQGLSALFGGVGRFIAFALLVVVFAVGVVSTVPGPLAAIGDASPVGAALGGFQAIASSVSGAGGAAALLALWGLGGLALTAIAVVRARSRQA